MLKVEVLTRRDIKFITRDVKRVHKNVVPRALSASLNRTRTWYRTRVVRDAAKALGVRQKVLRQTRIWDGPRATIKRTRTSLILGLSRMGIHRFGAKAKSQPIANEAIRGSGVPFQIPGKEVFFVRAGPGRPGRARGQPDLPIELAVTNVGDALERAGDTWLPQAGTRWRTVELPRALRARFRKRRR